MRNFLWEILALKEILSYSKNYDFVPLPLPSRYHFLQAWPIVHHRDTIVPDRPSPSTVPDLPMQTKWTNINIFRNDPILFSSLIEIFCQKFGQIFCYQYTHTKILLKNYRKTPYLVPGITYIFRKKIWMLEPVTNCS